MDFKSILTTIVGAVILGALAYVFNSIGELKHQQDTQSVKIDQMQSEQKDLWNKYNVALDKQVAFGYYCNIYGFCMP
jgi:glutamate synthase domain-containing protein 3